MVDMIVAAPAPETAAEQGDGLNSSSGDPSSEAGSENIYFAM